MTTGQLNLDASVRTDPVGPLLRLQDLHVTFRSGDREFEVVSGMTLTVAPGQVVGLVGESGSGKSITCLSLLGLLPASAVVRSRGVWLDGVDLSTRSRRQLEDVRGRDVGFVFQDAMASLNPAITVGEQIAESVRRHTGASRRQAARRAIELLERVGIPDPVARAKNRPHEMSGGMCQRVMIAIALACEPKLLIADEPTTALDVTIQAQILDLLRDLARERSMAVILVTHDLGVVADLCDRVVVMYAGELVEEADVHTLFERPRHHYTAALLRSTPRLGEAVLDAIPGSVPHAGEYPPGCRFAPRCTAVESDCREIGRLPLTTDPNGSVRCLHPLREAAHTATTEGPQ